MHRTPDPERTIAITQSKTEQNIHTRPIPAISLAIYFSLQPRTNPIRLAHKQTRPSSPARVMNAAPFDHRLTKHHLSTPWKQETTLLMPLVPPIPPVTKKPVQLLGPESFPVKARSSKQNFKRGRDGNAPDVLHAGHASDASRFENSLVGYSTSLCAMRTSISTTENIGENQAKDPDHHKEKYLYPSNSLPLWNHGAHLPRLPVLLDQNR